LKETILSINQLSKNYGRIKAVDNLSLDIEKGNVYGILGPNGSGKTTTIGIVLGVINADSGSFKWLGNELTNIERKHIGSIIETPLFYPYLTAIRNLRIVADIKGLGYESIEKVLKTVDLFERKNDKFKTYSLGMKQRLALAAAMIGNPEMMILDEPTNGLDPQGIAETRNLIKRIASDGTTILLASHLLDEVQKVCSHVAVLNHGKTMFSGDVDEVLTDTFTIEIARKIGFSISLLQKIDEKADRRQLDFEEQLQQLEVDKKALELKQQQIGLMDEHLAETLGKYQSLYVDLQKEKKAIIAEANKESKAILKQSNRLIEKTIKEIRESDAEKTKTQSLRKEIKEKIDSIEDESELISDTRHKFINNQIAKNKIEEKTSKSKPLKAGDLVIVSGQNTVGTIALIKGKKAKVDFDTMQMFVELDRLNKASKTQERKLNKTQVKSSNIAQDMSEKAMDFNPNIDVRGMRAEEALIHIQRFLDDAILLGVHQIHILHGKGTGALRQTIQEYLRANRDVERYYDEHIERGGHGITVVEM